MVCSLVEYKIRSNNIELYVNKMHRNHFKLKNENFLKSKFCLCIVILSQQMELNTEGESSSAKWVTYL